MRVRRVRAPAIAKFILYSILSRTAVGNAGLRGPDVLMLDRGTVDLRASDKASFLHRESGASRSYLRYIVTKLLPDVLRIEMDLPNVSLSLEIDSSKRTAFINGSGATLTAEHKVSLSSLSRSRSETNGTSDIVARLAAYAAEAPADHRFLPRRLYWGNIKVRCLKEGQAHLAVWTDRTKQVHNVSVVVGSTAGPYYECMGRCGRGCGKQPKKSVYTQNCLNHDVCSWEVHAKKGRLDRDCGDEYKKAMPDYLFGESGCKKTTKEGQLKVKKTVRASDATENTSNSIDVDEFDYDDVDSGTGWEDATIEAEAVNEIDEVPNGEEVIDLARTGVRYTSA